MTADDVLTADFTCLITGSESLEQAMSDILDLQTKAAHDKGYFATITALESVYPIGNDGDYAIIGSTDTIWVWDSDSSTWKDTHQATDLSSYYTKTEINTLLGGKEPSIVPSSSENPADYYYNGEKTWSDLLYKIRNAKLDGLDTTAEGEITDTDSVVSAFGKTQAQITDLNTLGFAFVGDSEPTDDRVIVWIKPDTTTT